MPLFGPSHSLSPPLFTWELDFTAADAYDQYLRAGFTCTRNYEGRYWDASGKERVVASGVPRFPYDRVTRKPLGLMSDVVLNQYCQNSENLNAWTKTGVGFANLAKGYRDPNGGNDAWSVKLSDVTNSSTLSSPKNAGALTDGWTINASIWARCDITKVVTFGSSTAKRTTYTLTPEWQRLSYTGVWNTADPFVNQILIAPGGDDPEARVYLWHPMTTDSGTPTEYVPSTGTGAVTGAAEYHTAGRYPLFSTFGDRGLFEIEWAYFRENNSATSRFFHIGAAGAITTDSLYGQYSTTQSRIYLARGVSGVNSTPYVAYDAAMGEVLRASLGWQLSGTGFDGYNGAVNGLPTNNTLTGETVRITPSRIALGGSESYPSACYIRKVRYGINYSGSGTGEGNNFSNYNFLDLQSRTS